MWVKGSSKDQRDPAAKRVEQQPAQASQGLSEPLQGWDEQAQPETGKIKGADDSYLLLLNAFPQRAPPRPGNKGGPEPVPASVLIMKT